MNYVAAKCTQCGASINIDSNKKSGYCPNCGTKYFTKDVTINNYSSYTYNESIDGKTINRQAVLEKMLVNYYNGKFNDIDNLKEYSFKVLEIDEDNILANFVAFKNISNKDEIIKLLENKDLKLNKELFETLINQVFCYDGYLYFSFIINSDFDKEEKINYLCKIKNPKFDILNDLNKGNNFEVVKNFLKAGLGIGYMQLIIFVSLFNFSAVENEELIGIIEDLPTTSKYLFVKQLLNFINSNSGFEFGNKYEYEQKYDKYKLMEKKLKEKKMEETKKQTTYLTGVEIQEVKKNKKFNLFNIFKKKK